MIHFLDSYGIFVLIIAYFLIERFALQGYPRHGKMRIGVDLFSGVLIAALVCFSNGSWMLFVGMVFLEICFALWWYRRKNRA